MASNCREDFCDTLRKCEIFVFYKEPINAPEVNRVEEVLYVDVEYEAPSTVNRVWVPRCEAAIRNHVAPSGCQRSALV